MAESRLGDFKRLFREVSPCLHVKEIAQRLGIPRQSVYRLRDRLRDNEGIWLEEHTYHPDVPSGHFRWPRDQPFNEDVLVSLNAAEVEALKTAAERMEHVTPLVTQALQKLAEGKPLERALNTESVLYTPLSDSYLAGLFERVSSAIHGRRVVEVTYRNSKGEENTYNFNPYLIVTSNQHLHLIGVTHLGLEAGSAEPIRLRLDQIRAFKQTRERFPKPALDVRAWADRAFSPFAGEGEPVPVKVRFSTEKAQFIRRTPRHITQQVEEQEDGSVVWSIVAPLSEGLVHWVSSYGPHAEVLEPRELREQVRAWAQGSVAANR